MCGDRGGPRIDALAAPPRDVYDFIIIGGGVVGLSIARELSRYDVSVIVVEKNPELGLEASRGNAGVVHAFQLPMGSLKGRLCLAGNQMFDELAGDLGFRFRRVGLLVVALNIPEAILLLAAYIYFKVKGLEVNLLSSRRLLEVEPGLRGAIMALHFPSAGVVSPTEYLYALAENASMNGVKFLLGAEVKDIEFRDGLAVVKTGRGAVRGRWVINAAGIGADEISRMAGFPRFRITPLRGAHLVFDSKWAYRHLLAEAPLRIDPRTKGGGALLTVDGRALWGPNLDEGPWGGGAPRVEREDYDLIISKYSRLVEVPGKPVRAYAGLRAASDTGDFYIRVEKPGFVNVGGIQSPGLTASPAIAKVVVGMVKRYVKLNPKRVFRAHRPPIPSLRDSPEVVEEIVGTEPGYGEILCEECMLSEAEVAEAVRRGGRTLEGVIGRLGLDYETCMRCVPRILRVMSRELGIPISEILRSRYGSEVAVVV